MARRFQSIQRKRMPAWAEFVRSHWMRLDAEARGSMLSMCKYGGRVTLDAREALVSLSHDLYPLIVHSKDFAWLVVLMGIKPDVRHIAAARQDLMMWILALSEAEPIPASPPRLLPMEQTA